MSVVTDDMLFTAATVDLKAGTAKRPTISIVAYGGGIMEVGGWGPVAIDLEGLDAAGQVPLLADHDARVSGVVGHGSAETRDGRL